MSKKSHEQQLAELKREYIEALPDKLKEITSAWEHLQFVNWDNKKLDKLKFVSHELVGVGANLGFPDISDSAKLLDEQLRSIDNNANSDERTQIAAYLAQLKKAIKHAVSAELPVLPDSTAERCASIAILEDDKAQAEFLKLKLQLIGYTVHVFDSPQSFAKDLSRAQFDLLILDVSFPEGPLEGLFWLESINKKLQAHCPIIIISARSDFVARMRAVRAGASAYIAKPLDIDEVHKQISYCLKQQKASETRVLCVDDDIQQQKLYKIILGQEGLIYDGLTQPLKIIESMEAFQPDLIIMDYEMPGCNGAEIAAMLRQDIRFMTIPIIFASGSDKALQQQEQLSILGNAFVKKPFVQQELIAQIKTQLSKAKYVSQKIEQISQRIDKNGLQTKRFFLENLETLLYQNDLPDQNIILVYAAIDNIDFLKERFGLRHLANLNAQLESYLARHHLIHGNGCTIGNASFLMLVYLDKSEDEKNTLHQLQQIIAQQSWELDDKTCKVTLTMGALALQQSNNLDEVITKIEKACFDGMSVGGSRVEWVKSVQQKQELLDDKIKSLMKEQSFKLFYQPIVNLETDRVLFEALIRLVDQDGHVFSPDQFLAWIDAELEGGGVRLDRWLIENAVAAISQISLEHKQGTTIILKLASSLTQIVGLLPEIRFAMQKKGMPDNGKIIFALPTTTVIKDVSKFKQVIESLEELGCGFMLEKVETTDAHLKLLNDIGKIDIVKISVSDIKTKNLKSFISNINNAAGHAPTLVASGIEDSAMLAKYWELGIRNFQGYFIQKPDEELKYIDSEE
jgi:multidomain signaling protein FimX